MCSDPNAYCLRVVSDTDFFLFLAISVILGPASGE